MPNSPRPGKANPHQDTTDAAHQQEVPQQTPASSGETGEQEQKRTAARGKVESPAAGKVKGQAKKTKAGGKAGGKAGATEAHDGGKDAAPADLPNVPIGALVDARFSNAHMHSTEATQAIQRCDDAIRVAAQVLVTATRPETRDHALHQLRLAQLSIRDAIGRSGR